MGGDRIRMARSTLELFLHSLPAAARFNIIGFGSRYELLYEEAVPATEETLGHALRHVKHVEADLGGTEIRQPLGHVLGQTGRRRAVFVLTDGQVCDTEAVIRLVRERKGAETRVFTIGVGESVSASPAPPSRRRHCEPMTGLPSPCGRLCRGWGRHG